jgi:hypothetical protein
LIEEGFVLYQGFQFLYGDSRLLDDIVESALFEFLVKGNNDAYVFFEIVHEDMASALVIHYETDSTKGLDDLFA